MRKEDRVRQQRQHEGEQQTDRTPEPRASDQEQMRSRSDVTQPDRQPRQPGSKLPLPD